MGLIGRLLGTEDDEEGDEFFEEFEEEFEESEEFEEDIAVAEWENAYEFTKDALSRAYGFSDMSEFVAKAMIYRINNSERYRDRIAIGRETMDMITDTVDMAQGIGGGGPTDWEDAVDQLKGVKEVKDVMDDMVDKEELMLYDMLDIARDGIDIFKARSNIGDSDVDTSVRRSDDDI